MDDVTSVSRLLLEPMRELAQALRKSHDRVVERWNRQVKELLPDADELTARQVRDTIPVILNHIADTLESAERKSADVLIQVTKSHGVARFHEHYDMRERIVEYRILRLILIEEMDSAYAGTVSTREWMALDVAVDISLQQAVISFFEHQKTQLKSATEAEAKFLAFLSHDMRNSLNSILLVMQWVEESLAKYPQLNDELLGLRAARASANDTITGMERILQAERLRRNVSLKHDRIDLMTLARETIKNLASGAHLISVSGDVTEAVVVTDGGLVRQILMNLLSNAVKYGEGKPVTVLVEKVQDPAGDGWTLSVMDRGGGIPPENMANLFDAFQRGATRGQPGVGLGLFIASQAARLLGARLDVASKVGEGTRFSLVLRDLPRDAD